MNTARTLLVFSSAALLLSACQSQEITSPASQSDLTVLQARTTTPGYTPIEIGTLPGDVESYAPAVNNSGHVAVSSAYYSSTEQRRGRWFIRVGSQNFILESGAISDLSNGGTTYVAVNTAADGHTVPALLTFSTVTNFSDASILDYTPGPGGSVQAVGDAGQAAGSISYGAAAIWNTDGTRTDIPNVDPAVFESVVVRDINNSGDVVVLMADNDRNHHRAYLRTSDGRMKLLPPLAGDVSSLVRGVSENVNGVLYVAGTTDDRQGNYRAVRWTVDVETHQIIGEQVRAERSSSMGIADDGTVIGNSSTSGSGTPFVWRMNNTTVTLKAPKGLTAPQVWSISGNGQYLSGAARSGSYNKAVYWVATP